MIKTDKPFWGVCIFLGALSFFPLALPHSSKIDEVRSPLFVSFPLQLGNWRGKDVPLDDRTYEILETRNVLSRVYENPKGESLHLLLVGSHEDRRVAHPPEVCYRGSGYTITNETENKFAIGDLQLDVKEFIAKSEKNPQEQQDVLYLYKVGNQYTTNYYSQQIHFALARLAKQESQVLLIRLAAPNKNYFSDFLKLLVPELSGKSA